MEENKVNFLFDIFTHNHYHYNIYVYKQFYCCFREKLRLIFETTIVAPCSFTFKLYLNYYFPNEEYFNEYLNALIKT